VYNPKSKNKSSAIFVVGIFAAVMIIMFVAQKRSQNVQIIKLPLNNGIVTLLTYNDLLAALSNDNKMYVLEWSDLSKKPKITDVESSEAVFAAHDTVLSVKPVKPDYLVVSGVDVSGVSKKISISMTSKSASLSSNKDGSKVILLLERGDGEHIVYEFFEAGNNAEQIRPIVTVEAGDGNIKNVAISDDGRYAAAAGEKKGHGWLVVVDIKDKKILWQKELPDLKKLFKAVFSGDGEIIYIRGSDSMLTLVKAGSGEIADHWLPAEETQYNYRTQPTQAVAISRDGELVAAVIGGSIYIWDTKTRKKYDIGSSGHKVFSSMVFSPDAKFIATSDMRQGGNIRIFRTPRH
jgi:hypothetical protein